MKLIDKLLWLVVFGCICVGIGIYISMATPIMELLP